MSKKLLTQVGFSKENSRPFLRFSDGDEIILHELDFNQELNLKFDLSKRFCTGWFNPNNGENHVCPAKNEVEAKYEQCKDCMIKTGFNPSFYNADSISNNQAEYNTHPHILYLAYFSPDDVKVGISHSGRNLSRLLEQGARLAYILETFPSANIARQYEARISRLDGMVENVKLGRKVELLRQNFDETVAEKILSDKKAWIEEQIRTKFDNAQLVKTNAYFFAPDFDQSRLRETISLEDQGTLHGKFVGALGQILICDYQGDLIALPLKKMVGYYYDEDCEDTEIELPSTQFSLF